MIFRKFLKQKAEKYNRYYYLAHCLTKISNEVEGANGSNVLEPEYSESVSLIA